GQEMVTYVQSVERGGVQGSSVFDPFLRGRVAMRVDTNYFLRDILFLTPDLAFGVAAMPLPEGEATKGIEAFGWGGGWAYAIPSTSQEKEAAWEVIRWIAGDEANRLLIDYQMSLARARGQQFLPDLPPDRRTMNWLAEEVIGKELILPLALVKAYFTFAELLPGSRYRPVTPVGQQLWNEQVRAADLAITHRELPSAALARSEARVQRSLNQVLSPPEGTPINWRLLVGIYIFCVLALIAGIIVIQEKKRRAIGEKSNRKWVEGYICALPWLLGFIVFYAGPILFSLVISFSTYDILNPARFAGLQNYTALMGFDRDPDTGSMVARDPLFWKSLWNTLFMVILLPLQIVIGLGIAMLLNMKVRCLGLFRTIYYLPAMVPAIAAFLLWLWLFDPGRGLVNQFLLAVGVRNPPLWIDDPALAKPSMIIMLLWGVGASMIIWLAGLKDIPRSLYEAAEVDGASPIQKFFTITIPMLTPYILFNLIIGLIAIFQLFEPAYIMTNGGPSDSTYFFAYKLFDEAFRMLDMGAASAMAWILFIAVLIVTILQLWFSRRWVYYGGE
ncbi:MAG: extracellular solute-binding protein, partial [Candidatus Sumerlaeia bacterium]|nr:extracellular solute-binding protein [Candidatus Sumerlaeia bacterium]